MVFADRAGVLILVAILGLLGLGSLWNQGNDEQTKTLIDTRQMLLAMDMKINTIQNDLRKQAQFLSQISTAKEHPVVQRNNQFLPAIAPPTINGDGPLHQMQKRVLDTPRQVTAPPNKNGYIPGHDGTFAQNYQDTWFEAVARHNGWLSRPGFFLDLGAFKPYECSNSALLELKYGWNGICVEPREFSYGARTAIVANRAMSGDSGQAINMNVVAGDDDGQMFQMAATQHRTFKPVKTINVPDLISCVNAPLPRCVLEGRPYKACRGGGNGRGAR